MGELSISLPELAADESVVNVDAEAAWENERERSDGEEEDDEAPVAGV